VFKLPEIIEYSDHVQDEFFFNTTYNNSLQTYKNNFNSTPPAYVWKSSNEEFSLFSQCLLNVNLYRLTLYKSYEHFVTKTERYTNLKSDYPNSGHDTIIEMLHTSHSDVLPAIMGRTMKFERLKFNQTDRQNARSCQTNGQNTSNFNKFEHYLWRGYYSSDKEFARSFVENPEPSLFSKGGYKFCKTSDITTGIGNFNLNSTYVVHPKVEIRNIKHRDRREIEHINLDDIADDADDSIHQYHSQKYKSINNMYLLRGRNSIKDVQDPKTLDLYKELFLS
jgi:hypothetical protein